MSYSDFVRLAAQHSVQAENHGAALVDKVFGVVERLGNFILSLGAAESVRVVAREVTANAEMVRWAELIVVVSQDCEQILELVARALEAGERRLAVAIHQHQLTRRWARTATGWQ